MSEAEHVLKHFMWNENFFQVTKDVIGTISEVVGADLDIVTKAEIHTQSATKILLLLDEFARNVGEIVQKENKSISISGKNAAFSITYSQAGYTNVVISKGLQGNVSINIESIEKPEFPFINRSNSDLSSSVIPPDVFERSAQVVHSFFYKDDTLFQTKGDLTNLGSPLLQSNVLAVTVGNKRIENLVQPVKFRFRKVNEHNLGKDEIQTSVCAFWNFNKSKYIFVSYRKFIKLVISFITLL